MLHLFTCHGRIMPRLAKLLFSRYLENAVMNIHQSMQTFISLWCTYIRKSKGCWTNSLRVIALCKISKPSKLCGGVYCFHAVCRTSVCDTLVFPDILKMQ